MRILIRMAGAAVLGVAAASVYSAAMAPMNGQQAFFFLLIIAAVPAVIMSFKERDHDPQ